MFLAGEWVHSNLLFSAAFLVAGVGCAALGVYVVRKDRENRRLLEEETMTAALAVEHEAEAPGTAPPAEGATGAS